MAQVKVVVTVPDRVAANRVLDLLPAWLHENGIRPAEIRITEE